MSPAVLEQTKTKVKSKSKTVATTKRTRPKAKGTVRQRPTDPKSSIAENVQHKTPSGKKDSDASKRDLASKELGKRGEDAAARFLMRHDFEILERNWKCPMGEADIIALQDDVLCFIEVKTRTGVEKGFPSEAVDARKRARYEKIAAMYLQDWDCDNLRVRFDVIAIVVLNQNHAFLRHHVNAFGSM